MKMKKVIIYDASSEAGPVGLTWKVGANAFPLLGKVDQAIPVHSKAEFIAALKNIRSAEEIHFWGHGAPGRFKIGTESIRKKDFEGELGDALREAIPSYGLFWLRTCASFQGKEGKEFAEAMSASLKDIVVAAHVYNIGIVHSGLKVLKPGEMAEWSDDEGTVTENNIKKSVMSNLFIPDSFLFWKDSIG